MKKRILFVTTNFSKINDNIKTGVWFEEFAVPFLVFEKTGYEIVVASPLGGNSPIDVNSLSCSNPMEWDYTAKFLKNTIELSKVDYKMFDAIYLPGGHAPMFDLANSELLKKVIEYFYEKDKVISAVCHGVAGLVLAKDKNGYSIVRNKNVTSFTNKEEKIVKMVEFMPFLLESRLKFLGCNFVEEKPWSEHVEICDNLITGQNQNSALLLAESVISVL